MRFEKWSLSCAVLWALWLHIAAAHADPIAESLFTDAKALMDDGNYAEACPKLEASQKRDPRSGTLIRLGYCHEQLGKTATAWAEYRQAIALANQEKRPEFADKAAKFAERVAPKLSRLTVVATSPQTSGAELDVKLDGESLDPGSFNVAVPVDPGTHEISASAPGFSSWSQKLVIGQADLQQIKIPELVAEVSAPPVPSGPRQDPPPPQAVTSTSIPRPDDVGRGVPVWAWIAGGFGIAGGILSAVFFADMASAGSALDEACGSSRQSCPGLPGYDHTSDRSREERGQIFGWSFAAVGVAGITTALIGIVTAQDATEVGVAPWLGSDVAGWTYRATF